MEMPLFTRENADDWVFRAECYFLLYRLTETEEAMGGDALVWNQWQDGCRLFCSWDELKAHLLQRFQSTQEEFIYGSFMAKERADTKADSGQQI